jgi:hypothetical protein
MEEEAPSSFIPPLARQNELFQKPPERNVSSDSDDVSGRGEPRAKKVMVESSALRG